MSDDLTVRDIETQISWSKQTFGPGDRTEGILDHINKEIKEVRNDPTDVYEWVDIMILAIDGAWRNGIGAQELIDAYHDKMSINIERSWPDWRQAEPGKAIEHDRSRD